MVCCKTFVKLPTQHSIYWRILARGNSFSLHRCCIPEIFCLLIEDCWDSTFKKPSWKKPDPLIWERKKHPPKSVHLPFLSFQAKKTSVTGKNTLKICCRSLLFPQNSQTGTEQSATGWSPSWPLVRDTGVPSPRRVPVVNFTSWELSWWDCWGLLLLDCSRDPWKEILPSRATVGHTGRTSVGSSRRNIPTYLCHLGPLSPTTKAPRAPAGLPFVPSFYSTPRGAGSRTQNGGSAALWTFPWLKGCLEAKRNETLGIEQLSLLSIWKLNIKPKKFSRSRYESRYNIAL